MKQTAIVLAALLGLGAPVVIKTKSNEGTDNEHKSMVQNMWNSAVQPEEAPVESAPFHFDLLGLAQGLS